MHPQLQPGPPACLLQGEAAKAAASLLGYCTASDEGTLIIQRNPASPHAVLANRASDTWELLEQVQVGGALKFSQWHMILNEHNVRHLLQRQCFLCLQLYLSSFDPASELSVYAGFEAMVEDRVSLW